MDKDPYNLIITGVGGQGNVLASQIIGRHLVDRGYKVTIGETYGASQRGGSVMSHLRLSRKRQFSPLIPEGQADLVVALEPTEGLRVLGHYGNDRVRALVNTRLIYPLSVLSGESQAPVLDQILSQINQLTARLWTVNATAIALKLGQPILANVALLGALEASGAVGLERAQFEALLRETLPSGRVADNLAAFDQGRTEVREYAAQEVNQ
ncbi:MAG: indolepyruvate oxidoreductase subunit beta [Deltaproteobacteria bacterium]|nr:indolepyruvate oxidoreductase subunit beta [Deltaproteobacteria bacterium]